MDKTITDEQYKIALEEYERSSNIIKIYHEENNIGHLMNNIEHARQPILYDKLDKGNIHPTDIDALLEFDNKYLIPIEVKYRNADIPLGQNLSLTRITDNWVDSGKFAGIDKKAIVFKASHNTPPSQPIILADCIVTEYYLGGSWIKNDNPVNVKRAIDIIARKWNITKLLY